MRESSRGVPGVPVVWITPTVRPMIDIGTQTAEQRPCARPRELRTGVERLAVGESLGLRAPRRGAVLGRVDRATGGLAVGDGRHDHAVEVRVAVVGEQELDG